MAGFDPSPSVQRSFRWRADWQIQVAVPGRRRINVIAVGDGTPDIRIQVGFIQHPPRSACHLDRAGVRPSVARIDNPHPVQGKIEHRARCRADVLAKLRPHQYERRLGIGRRLQIRMFAFRHWVSRLQTRQNAAPWIQANGSNPSIQI